MQCKVHVARDFVAEDGAAHAAALAFLQLFAQLVEAEVRGIKLRATGHR